MFLEKIYLYRNGSHRDITEVSYGGGFYVNKIVPKKKNKKPHRPMLCLLFGRVKEPLLTKRIEITKCLVFHGPTPNGIK